MASSTFRHLPLIIGLIAVAAASRLLPHPPNFVPVGAMALFGAAALPKKWLAVLVPLVAFYLSDLALNNIVYAAHFDGWHFGADPFIYGAVALMILVGMLGLRGKVINVQRVGGAAVVASLVFFLVSNFGVWAGGLMYPKTFSGLLLAYGAGLPFLGMSLLANLLFSGVFFYFGVRTGIFNSKNQPAYVTATDLG